MRECNLKCQNFIVFFQAVGYESHNLEEETDVFLRFFFLEKRGICVIMILWEPRNDFGGRITKGAG